MGNQYSLKQSNHWIAPSTAAAAAATGLAVIVGATAIRYASCFPRLSSCGTKVSEWTDSLAHYILTKHRSLVVVTFGLPLSFLWDVMLHARTVYVHALQSAPTQHRQKVAEIVEQIRARPPDTPMCTSRPGWMSISLSFRDYKQRWQAIRMHNLIDVLNVDAQHQTVHVEPFVTIGQLTKILLPMGYTLPVVPEMDDLTVGGLVNGTGIESSSHKFGLFHEMCLEYELCLGNGQVVVARADNEYSDLFHAIPWSYGTLALLLSAKLRMIPSKSHVKLTYTPHTNRASYLQHFAKLCLQEEDSPMFVEGLVYSQETAVIMSGELVNAHDVVASQTNGIGWWWKPWFYKHVESMLSSSESKTEYIPLREYYHRHSQSLFWEMELMIPIGNHVLFRWLLGWLMPPKVSFLKITQTEWTRAMVERTHVAQDFLIPLAELREFLEICHGEYDGIYPLWLCPHSHQCMPGSILRDPPNGKPVMYVDVGVYGLPTCVRQGREEEFDMRKSTRTVLQKLRLLGGFQMLYGDVYSTRDEFEQMYDHVEYRKLREKYGATTSFKEVYDKMNVCL
jgi:delta24-sterol reductase